jgi:hypothetical protein
MVVTAVVTNRRCDLPLCPSLVLVSPVAESDDVSEGHALERRPGLRVPLCGVPQGLGDVVQVGINDSACEDSAIWLESLPDDLESELVQARERGQVRQGKVTTGTLRPSAI